MSDATKGVALVRYEASANCSVCMEDDGPLFVEAERRDCTHIALPLDVSQIDDAAVEVMARAAWSDKRDMRAALAALLAHLAEVSRG